MNEAIETELSRLNRELASYKAKEILNQKQFKYELFDTHRGNTHIRILHEGQEGLTEVARVKLSQNIWVRGNFSIEDIFDDITR